MSMVQVLAELEQHFRHAGLYLSSVGTAQAPLLLGRRPLMATAVAARPQLQPGPATVRAPSTSNAPKLPHFATASSLPLPKKASKKRTRAESSNASLEAAINSLRSDISPAPSTFSDSPMFPPPPFTASMPVAAFGTSAARLALLAGGVGGVGGGGAPRPGPVFGNPTSFAPGTSAARSSGASAAGPPGNAALELSLLLTTLQSLAHLPEEQGQPINIIASSSQAAEAQLRDWLRQLQQHASDASGDLVSLPLYPQTLFCTKTRGRSAVQRACRCAHKGCYCSAIVHVTRTSQLLCHCTRNTYYSVALPLYM